MFRSEITEGHPGMPLSLTMTLVDTNADCAPVSGARVDLWHCDAAGVYSGFSQPGSDTVGQTFCRGIQLTDGNGQVTFQTVYPGGYRDIGDSRTRTRAWVPGGIGTVGGPRPSSPRRWV
jgi:protocatechuate 3,4-dioxygenase beta subunit